MTAVQLRMDIAPLAHAADVDDSSRAAGSRIGGWLSLCEDPSTSSGRTGVGLGRAEFLSVRPEPVEGPPLESPNHFQSFSVPAELAFLIIKLGMRLVGLGLLVHWAVAHVLHAERRWRSPSLRPVRRGALRFQDHAAHARVQRQVCASVSTDRREFVVIVHRAEFGQQLVAVGNGAASAAAQ